MMHMKAYWDNVKEDEGTQLKLYLNVCKWMFDWWKGAWPNAMIMLM